MIPLGFHQLPLHKQWNVYSLKRAFSFHLSLQAIHVQYDLCLQALPCQVSHIVFEWSSQQFASPWEWQKKVFDMCLRWFQRRTSYARSWMELFLKSFWVHGNLSIKIFLPTQSCLLERPHVRASQPVGGMFVHVYQWLVKGILHISSTTNNTMCDSDHSKTRKPQGWLPQKSSFLWLFRKNDNVLQIQCNDNIMYYNTVEECTVCPLSLLIGHIRDI